MTYTSFITCDDSKGVVECATIKKSKSGSQKMRPKIETRAKQMSPDRSLAYKAEKEKTLTVCKESREEYRRHSPRSFQVLEIFRETQKLQHVIDSGSRDLRYDGQFQDIEKELIKGTLDLQEALVMLGKLQEASKYMAQLKTKQNGKSQKGRTHEMGSDGTHTFQSRDQNHSIRSPRPLTSSNVSSRDFLVEARKAVSDNLAGQSSPSNTTTMEKAHLDGASEVPSTSSNQLSSNSTESLGSFRLQTAQGKVKGPNLIAKLMGLESMPQTQLEQIPQRHLDNDKNLRRERTVSDIEMQAAFGKAESEQRSLKEVLESMQLKGLLKRSFINDITTLSHHSGDFHSQHMLANDIQPVVLIKPLPVECLESEEQVASITWEDKFLNARIMPATTKVQRRLALSSTQYRKGYLNLSKNDRKTEAEETSTRRYIQEELAEEHSWHAAKPYVKRVTSIKEKERTVSANRIGKKLESEVHLTQRFVPKEGPKNPKAVARGKEKEAGTKLKASKQMQALIPPTHQQDGAEETHARVDKIQNDVINKKVVEKRKIFKRRSSPRFRDQAKETSTEQRKPENGSVITNTKTPKLHRKNPKAFSRHTTGAGIHDWKSQKIKDKALSEVKLAKQDTDDSVFKGNAKSIDPIFYNDSVLEISNGTPADQLQKQTEANVLIIQTQEHCSHNQSSPCNSSLLNCDYETYAIPKYWQGADGNRTRFKKGSYLKDLLMNNSSFLTQVDELFHLNLGCSHIATTTITKSEKIEMSLYLDYANEFIGRRRLKDSQDRHLLLPSYVGGIRISLTLGRLLNEVCDGVETLESYCDSLRNDLHRDDWFAISYRDIWCKEVVGGVWDLGWTNGFSAMESELAVNDIEKILAGELIEELFE